MAVPDRKESGPFWRIADPGTGATLVAGLLVIDTSARPPFTLLNLRDLHRQRRNVAVWFGLILVVAFTATAAIVWRLHPPPVEAFATRLQIVSPSAMPANHFLVQTPFEERKRAFLLTVTDSG